MIKLIKNAEIYAPQYLGRKDVLIAADKICKISEVIESNPIIDQELDATGKLLFPGFIDSHVHIAGAGGEAGFSSRTPEIMLGDLITAGITTLIGTLGTDGITRNTMGLLAKARALEEEGLTTFINTGSYQIPVKTITGSITDDIVLIDKIIGVGELALSDHRSSQPSFEEIIRIVSEAKLGGMLSKKSGTVNFHMGDSPRMLELIEQIVDNVEISKKNIIPTNVNRNEYLFEKAVEYALSGGVISITSSGIHNFIDDKDVKCSAAIKILIEKAVKMENVIMSSDGHGSLPVFDKNGKMIGINMGRVSSLYKEIQDAILMNDVPVEIALMTITSNPASLFKLRGKGIIAEGYDADIVLVDADTFEIDTVLAKGRLMMKNKALVVKGMFER